MQPTDPATTLGRKKMGYHFRLDLLREVRGTAKTFHVTVELFFVEAQLDSAVTWGE